MFNKYKKAIIISTIFTFVPLLISLIVWNRLPDQIPVHFNAQGDIDRYYTKIQTVLMMGLFFPLIHIICVVGTLSDPKRNNIPKKLFIVLLSVVPIIGTFTCLVSYGYALGLKIDVIMLTTMLIGIVFIIVGNYMPKCRQNYTVGIKIPWTLNDQENWDKTHRLAGVLYMIAGVVVFICGFFETKGLLALLPAMLIAGFGPIIYSFIFYLKKEKSR